MNETFFSNFQTPCDVNIKIKALLLVVNFFVSLEPPLPYASTCSCTTKMSTSRSLNRRKESEKGDQEQMQKKVLLVKYRKVGNFPNGMDCHWIYLKISFYPQKKSNEV